MRGLFSAVCFFNIYELDRLNETFGPETVAIDADFTPCPYTELRERLR